MFSIRVTTESPLCQIDESGTLIKVKKMKVLVHNEGEEPKVLSTPIYTANGFRGMLRRTAFEMMCEALLLKGKGAEAIGGPTNFHILNAGGGNNFPKQTIDVEKRVRELNPLASVFGVSLAIEGKLIVENLIPKRDLGDRFDYCYYKVDEKDGRPSYLASNILAERTYIKRDDLLDHTGNAIYLSEQEIKDWEFAVNDNHKARKATADLGDSKVKKESIKHIQDQEYIIPGTSLYGAIDYKIKFTDLETGMLIRTLEKAALKRLGSGSNTGHGKVTYQIDFMDGCSIVSSVDKKTGFKINLKTTLTEDAQKCVNIFDQWLQDISEENIQLDKVLLSSESKDSDKKKK